MYGCTALRVIKQTLPSGWLLWAALLWALLPAPAAAQAVQPEEVAPGVWMVQGASALGTPANRNFISNAAFVVTPGGVLVVDALGSPALAQELVAAIRRITPAPIRYVVVTHYHADHIYGLQVFKDLGAEVIAHRDGRSYLQSETAALRLQASREELAPWIDAKTRLVAADRWIAETTRLAVGGVEVVLQPAGPAHTAEDLVVFLPQQRVLIAGDLVFRGRIPFVGQADSGRWIEALDRLIGFDATLIVPGHGPASRSASADLRLTRDYLLHLRQTMGEAAHNLEPFEEAYEKADWSRFEHLPLFRAANRINAYNTYLLMERSGR
ncbi:MAG: MBL fold metallo-hydrolase [Rubrivivax sp.]|nr:MBL fold metallo-hydrolase [Rubrivivax sp.]